MATMASEAFAGKYDHSSTITNNHYYGDEYFDDGSDNGIGNSDFSQFIAMQNSANYCVFDYAPGWQGCGSAGWYDGYTGYNLGLATRIDCWMVRFGVQTDEDFDEYSGGVGGSFHFGCK
jgi:hypothetical protein